MSRRRMTPEERALWRRAASTVRPLHENHVLKDHDGEDSLVRKAHKPGPAPPEPSGSGAAVVRHRPGLAAESRSVRGRVAAARADPFRAGDPRIERQVRRGRREIDAVFDLHGHTQSSARAALHGFLLEARARRYACVLIITGKGVRRALSEDPGQSLRGGVLRERFQDWMREDAFRQHVIRVGAAHERHGGGGAFYVFLKRRG